MTPEASKTLRAPFPPEQVGKLPKGGQMLDFVGHADVTDRLLNADPDWSWEPMGLTPEGLPALDRFGNLWIRLTVDGTTRIGVGDGKSMKECIGDALRNAAMRFGVALDLWAKGDRHFGIEGHDAPVRHQTVGGEHDALSKPVERHQGNPGPDQWQTPDPLADLKREVWTAAQAPGIADRDALASDYQARMDGRNLHVAGEPELREYLALLAPEGPA
jgi:hypothetical protein